MPKRFKGPIILTLLTILALMLSQKATHGAPSATVNITTPGSSNYTFFEGKSYWFTAYCQSGDTISLDLEYNAPKDILLTYWNFASGIWPANSPEPESKILEFPVTVDSVTKVVQQDVTIKWIANQQGNCTIQDSPLCIYDLGSKGYLNVSAKGSTTNFRAGDIGWGMGIMLSYTLTPSPTTLFLDVAPQKVEVDVSPSLSSDLQYKTVQISSFGTGILNWEIVEDCDWLEVTPTSGLSSGEINNITLVIDPNGHTSGTYKCTLTVMAEGALNTPINVDVTLHIKAILHVPQDYSTIQAAIDDAENGDTVLVAPGKYAGDGNKNIDFKGKAITVCSENGPVNCIIESDDDNPGFNFHNGEDSNSIVSGFTVTNARGGFYIAGSSPKISNCIITGNRGVYEASGSRCGAGVYIEGISAWGEGPTKPIIENCTITNNTVQSGEGLNGQFSVGNAYGAGIFVGYDQVILTLKNCVISNNKCFASDRRLNIPVWYAVSSAYGAGLYLTQTGGVTISNCTIINNDLHPGRDIAGNRMGEALGASVNCQYDNKVKIENSIIWDNKAYYYNSSSYKDSEIEGSALALYTDIKDGYTDSGNINLTPCFAAGTCRLTQESPCINAGDPNYAPDPSETDLDGNPRIIGGRIDIGAYEFNHIPIACIAGGSRTLEAQDSSGAQVRLDGSCSSDADSTAGTNDDINDFNWYRIDPCDVNNKILLGKGEIIDCNMPLGLTEIILEVTDKADATDSNEITVTVQDTAPPVFKLSVTPTVLWPPNHKMVKITPSWMVKDDCDSSPVVSVVGITTNDRNAAKDDIQVMGNGDIYLRAEKERIYTITYKACDESGNCTTQSAVVTVPHDNGKGK